MLIKIDLLFFGCSTLLWAFICFVLIGGKLVASKLQPSLSNFFYWWISAAIFLSANDFFPKKELFSLLIIRTSFYPWLPALLLQKDHPLTFTGCGTRELGKEGLTLDFPDIGLKINSSFCCGRLANFFIGARELEATLRCTLRGVILSCYGISILCLKVRLKKVSRFTKPFNVGLFIMTVAFWRRSSSSSCRIGPTRWSSSSISICGASHVELISNLFSLREFFLSYEFHYSLSFLSLFLIAIKGSRKLKKLWSFKS